ncbi:sulfatase-like hydrolase/transferase, partial [candidate division CSSED10-310 bacterium]
MKQNNMKPIVVLLFLVLLCVSINLKCSFLTPRLVPLNILFITIDALRADHLGSYGYPRHTSPFLDYFSKQSHFFIDASVQVPKTSPSIASIMTSQYANINCVVANPHYLSNIESTLAEFIQKNGITTVAYTTNGNLREQTGMAQGFDEFSFLAGARNGKILTETATERLRQGFTHNFFLWLHYLD